MAERKPSTVASYLSGASRPAEAAWKGGKGRRGPLANWLIRERAAIVEGKTPGTRPILLTWEEVAELAYRDGVVRKSGGPYRDYDVRKKWSELAEDGFVPRILGEGQAAVHRDRDKLGGTPPAPDNRIPPAGGQGGVSGTGGFQPPVPTTPSPQPGTTRPTSQDPEQPRRDARSMPRIRRPGDED